MNRYFVAATLVVALFGLARGSDAGPIYYETSLSGLNEVPENPSPGSGYALLTLDLDANLMRLEVEFQGLIGMTAAVHIHGPAAPGVNASVLTQLPSFVGFPLGVSSGTYDQTFDLGLASTYNPAFFNGLGGGTAAGAAASFAAILAEGNAYLNIHSTVYPGGEIRGNFAVIPEPSSLAMVGLGASGLAVGLARLRRRSVRPSIG